MIPIQLDRIMVWSNQLRQPQSAGAQTSAAAPAAFLETAFFLAAGFFSAGSFSAAALASAASLARRSALNRAVFSSVARLAASYWDTACLASCAFLIVL